MFVLSGSGPSDISFLLFEAVLWRGRPQDLPERVKFKSSCRNQGSLPSEIGSKAIFVVGDRPRGPSCVIRKSGLIPDGFEPVSVDPSSSLCISYADFRFQF